MKKHTEMISTLLTTFIVILAFQNCAKHEVANPKIDAATLNNDGTPDGTAGDIVDSSKADPKPVSVNYSENLLISMQNQLGVATPSAKTLAAFTAGKGQLSAKGPFNNVETVNQPMWGAITTIAGEFCVDTINLEKAKTIGTAAAPGPRSFFNQVDFTRAPASVSDTARSDVIRRLALAVWGRTETAAEQTLIKTTLDAILALPPVTGTSVAVQTENAMLVVCSTMLASLDGVRN